jgi:hypothetical protein
MGQAKIARATPQFNSIGGGGAPETMKNGSRGLLFNSKLETLNLKLFIEREKCHENCGQRRQPGYGRAGGP